MKDTNSNKMNGFKSTPTVTDRADFTPVWNDQPPPVFSAGIPAIRPPLAAAIAKDARQRALIASDEEALKNLRTDCERYLHRLALATFQALTRLGRTEDAAQVTAWFNARQGVDPECRAAKLTPPPGRP
jgi:hypothetical protein